MNAKKFESDRRRSRPVTKRRKTDSWKRNKPAMVLVIIIVAMLVLSSAYVVFSSFNDTSSDDIGDENLGNPIAVLDTTMGTIKIELYEDKVPITAGNFKDLANEGFYDSTKIHRISPGFMIQGGDPNSKDDDPSNDGFGDPGYTIQDEFHDDLSNIRGMISMANSGPNTGGCQFFILVGDAIGLNNQHAVFGNVIEGMDVVDEIADLDHDGRYEPSPGGGRPLTDVVINSIIIEYSSEV
jgi:cyclophilin family peptidyl-prolyl cis-trans isomerase